MRSQSLFELYQLIHSLSPHEKRYFKLFATFTGKKEENHYTVLFDLLNGSPSYQEDEFLGFVEQQSYAKHFQSTVYHLFHLILRSLKSFQSGKTDEAKLREWVEGARILFEKGQYKSAQKLLARARKKAEKREDSMILLEILELEQPLFFRTESKKLEERIDAHVNMVQAQIKGLEEKVILAALKDKHKVLRTKRAQSLSEAQQKKFNELMDHPLLKQEPPFFSMRAEQDYHHVHGFHAVLHRDYGKALDHFQTNAQAWEDHPEQIKRSPRDYVRALTELLSVCIVYKRYQIAEKVIEKLATIKPVSPEDELFLINQSCYTQLLYYTNTGRFEEGRSLIQTIDTLLKKYKEKVPVSRRINFYYNLTTFQFIIGEFREALRWLNALLNLPRSEVRQHLRDFGRVFLIVIHIELGNQDLVEYLYRSTYRHYQGKKKMGVFEKTVLTHLKQLIFPASPDDVEPAIRNMYKELWELALDKSSREPAGTYELIFWLESKIKGRSMVETFQERVRERLEIVAQDKDADELFKRGEEILKEKGE